MALAIDGSSPPVVTAATKTLATGSFTPPAGALLLALWAGNSTTATAPGAPTIADSQTDTYTRPDWQSRADSPTVDGQAADFWAVAAASTSMTVTSTSGTVATEFHQALGVRVMTGAHATPIGAHGKSGSTSAGSIAQNFTATATGSWGFLVVTDWDALGSMVAGTGCTLIGTGTIPTTQISYGMIRRTTADGVSGNTTTMNITIGGTSTHLSWTWIEVVPAAGAASPAWLLPPERRRLIVPAPWLHGHRLDIVSPAQMDAPSVLDFTSQPRRLRGLLVPRARVRQTVPPQFNPPFPFDDVAQPRRVRGLLPRRGRTATPVPPQQSAATPPPFVAAETRERLKLTLLRRHTSAGASAPLPDAGPMLSGNVRHRPVAPRLRRPSVDQPPTSTSQPPLAAGRHRVGVIRSRPVRAGSMVPPSAPVTPPARVSQPARRTARMLVWTRGHLRRFGPPLVGVAPVTMSVPGSIGLTTTAAGFGQSTSTASGQSTTSTASIGQTTIGGGP